MANDQPDVQFWGKKQYRPVFSNPHDEYTQTGSSYDTLEEAVKEHPRRSEETHAYLSGVEVRVVSPWRAMSLHDLMEVKR